MKSSVQLGLLFLSLIISSLHGEEEVETEDSSMMIPPYFDEPELPQFEMYRVRRQTVSEKENPAKTETVVQSGENSKTQRKFKRPGSLTPLGDVAAPTIHIYQRTKRQEKSKNNKRKKRPGSQSLLASSGVLPRPQHTVKVKRDAD